MTPQTNIRYQFRELLGLLRGGQNHRLYQKHDVIEKIHIQWPAHKQKNARERVTGVDSRADMPT